jgi:hypothetical protein
MHKLLTVLLICGIYFPTQLQAQYDWWPVRPGQISYYETVKYNPKEIYYNGNIDKNPLNGAYAIFIRDSIQTDSSTVFYLNRITTSNEFVYLRNHNCDYIFTNPFGLHFSFSGDSICKLFSITGNSLNIYLNESKIDTFIARDNEGKLLGRYVIAHLRDDTLTVFGKNDSIRVFSIIPMQNKDFDRIYDSIVLSKAHGAIRIPNINFIGSTHSSGNQMFDRKPTAATMESMIQLAGIDGNVNSKIKNLTYREIYNYDTGDVFCYYTYTGDILGISPREVLRSKDYYYVKVLQKWEYTDSIVYQVKQMRYNVFANQQSTDTNFLSFSKNINTDILPGLPMIFSGTNLESDIGLPRYNLEWYKFYDFLSLQWFNFYAVKRLENKRMIKYIQGCRAHYLSGNDTNCILTFEQAPDYLELELTESLGVTYSKNYNLGNALWNGFFSEFRLIHYKKGHEVWGESYPFPLSVNETAETENISVFPNPADDFVTIFIAEPAIVSVFDMTGKAVASYSLSQSEKISTESLSAGIYFIQINSGKYFKQTKLVVQH